MKTIKLLSLISLFTLAILSTNCKKESKQEFGDIQNNLKSDSIYKTTTDGFLYVEFVYTGGTYGTGKPLAKIYSDQTPNPSIEVGLVYYTTTLPLKKNNYWKVTNLTSNKLVINWTPLN